jgi:hypothetical protein
MSINKKIHLQKDLQSLLFSVLDEKNRPDIYIDPYKRYGKSGSSLFSIYFSDHEGGSLPFLLKTFKNKDKYEAERKGIDFIQFQYRYAQNIEPFDGNENLSGILLENHNDIVEKINDPKTLADIIYKDNENDICEIIEKTFKDFERVYQTTSAEEECSIKDEYAWYLRDDKTRGVIEKLTHDNIQNEVIEFCENHITNPVYILDNLIEKTEITKSLIHGDFHPNNIVLNDDNDPRLIDFAWSCNNDIYIDFSLLEMSVRYWKPPLMDNDTINDLEDKFLNDDLDDYNGSEDAQKMIAIVRKIRMLCKNYIQNYDFEHHLLSQFLILYGLQYYTDSYNPYIVTPFLAKLGDRIKSRYVK